MRRESSHQSSTFVILHSPFLRPGVSERSRTVTFWFTARRAETATLQTPSHLRIQFSAEGKGVEPSSQLSENRVSTAARPTISGYLPVLSVTSDGIEPSFPGREPSVVAVGPRGRFSSRDGGRTHKITSLSNSPLCRWFGYSADDCRFGSRTRRAELMKLGWALAHLQN